MFTPKDRQDLMDAYDRLAGLESDYKRSGAHKTAQRLKRVRTILWVVLEQDREDAVINNRQLKMEGIA